MGDLSKAQEAAVNWNGRGLLLSAAAGSGKTHTLTQRVVELVTNEDEKKRVHVTEILCVTFTKAAAQELRQRIGNKLRECLQKKPDRAKIRPVIRPERRIFRPQKK